MLAESFGVGAPKVSDPAALKAALDWAVVQPAPTPIEVSVGPMPNPWYLLEPQGI
jgi:acetolactate synthase I/II/III large subunit